MNNININDTHAIKSMQNHINANARKNEINIHDTKISRAFERQHAHNHTQIFNTLFNAFFQQRANNIIMQHIDFTNAHIVRNEFVDELNIHIEIANDDDAHCNVTFEFELMNCDCIEYNDDNDAQTNCDVFQMRLMHVEQE